MGCLPECTGLDSRREVDPELVVPDEEKSLSEGAVAPWTNTSGAEYSSDGSKRWPRRPGSAPPPPGVILSATAKKVVLRGFREQVHLTCRRGALPGLRRRPADRPCSPSPWPDAIAEPTALPIDQLARCVQHLEPAGWERRVADAVVAEIGGRLPFLLDVGLDHAH